MKPLALGAIRFYQRFLSPRKGFRCAYASVSGHGSCSALGYRAIRRYGVWRGLALLDKRLEKCGVAYRRHLPRADHRALGRQGGFLDCACDVPSGCDLPCNSASGCNASRMPYFCGDLLSCGICDCDWRRRKRDDDKHVAIPGRSNIAD